MSAQPFRKLLLCFLLLSGLSACASVKPEEAAKQEQEAAAASTSAPQEDKAQQSDATEGDNDPLEPLNRNVFEFNRIVDGIIMRPLAGLYRVVLPPPLRDLVSGILSNMGEPVNFLNFALQGEFSEATDTLGRFVVNTSFGAGGMFDAAKQLGLPKNETGFGETLHVWGAGEGPFLILPLLGPSTLRDASGFGVDMMSSPWGYLADIGTDVTKEQFTSANLAATFLSRRAANIEALDNLESGSLDFYATMRSVYRQFRNRQLGIELKIDDALYADIEEEAAQEEAAAQEAATP